MKTFKNKAVAFLLATVMAFAPTMANATSMTDKLENVLIDHLFRGTAYTAPTTWYFGLLTTTCTDSSGGTEVSGGSYARVGLAAGTTNFANTQNSGTSASSGTGGTTSNLVAVTFAAPTATWGSIVSFGVYDASSAGNLLICNALTVAKTVNNGDAAPSFAIGAFTFSVDN